LHYTIVFSMENTIDLDGFCRDKAEEIRKIYHDVDKCGDISDSFTKITGLEWSGDFSQHCPIHDNDAYVTGSCNRTMCNVMSPTTTKSGWFKLPKTRFLTNFSCAAIEHFREFHPYVVKKTLNYKHKLAPTNLVCVKTGLVTKNNSSREYFIVSHVWTSGNFTMVDGRLSKESKGYLWLERVSNSLEIPHAWIDSCCIDQNNPEDKQNEIPKMGDYYKNAQVCAVLPHFNDRKDVDDLVENMRMLSIGNNSFVKPMHAWALAGIYYSRLLADVWFTRIWTIQEVMLPDTVVVDSSNGLVNLKELLRFYDIIIKRVGSIPMSTNGMENAEMLSGSIASRLNMAVVLKLCAGREATFARDYVYGIMGMFPQVTMNVDYDAPIQQIVLDLYKQLIACGDISWLSWVGSSSIGRKRLSWIPTIGSYIMFVEWSHDMAIKSSRRRLMQFSCAKISVDVIGGSSQGEIYPSNVQPIVTLDDLSEGSNKCPACIAKIFCDSGCCQPWIIKEMSEEILETNLICEDCLKQEPNSSSKDQCMKHIARTFYRTLGSHLWLTKSKSTEEYILVKIKTPGAHLLYGNSVEIIEKGMKNVKAFVDGNCGWLFSANTLERIGVVVACSNGIKNSKSRKHVCI